MAVSFCFSPPIVMKLVGGEVDMKSPFLRDTAPRHREIRVRRFEKNEDLNFRAAGT